MGETNLPPVVVSAKQPTVSESESAINIRCRKEQYKEDCDLLDAKFKSGDISFEERRVEAVKINDEYFKDMEALEVPKKYCSESIGFFEGVTKLFGSMENLFSRK